MQIFQATIELADIELVGPFSFTKGCKVLKVYHSHLKSPWMLSCEPVLFNIDTDLGQEHPVQDEEVVKRMIGHMVRLMKKNDAPAEQFERLGLQEYVNT